MANYDSDYEIRLQTLAKLGGDVTKNYDSVYEIEASKNLHSFFTNDVIKTVKFKKVNKIEELIMQLDLVLNNFNLIVNSVKNYTINVFKNNNNNNKVNTKRKMDKK